MEGLLYFIVRRFRPKVGWSLALLTLVAASCPSIAAREGALNLPAGLIFWTGFAGVLLGLRAARARPLMRVLLLGPLALCCAAFLIVAGGRALPPFSLLWSDLTNLSALVIRWWQGSALVEPPEFLLWRFLGVALPRFWQELQAAPNAGRVGATLLVSMAALLSTWIGALCLSWAIAAQRPSFMFSQPLLGALALITILNGSTGTGLILGAGLLLLLAVASAHKAREREWERVNADYSDQLLWDVLGWSSMGIVAILSLAFMLPTTVPSVLANIFWPTIELPSGIAVIDEQVERERQQPDAQVGLSKLPSISLGVSLEQDTPETLALRIKTVGPLPVSAWPHYWRARLLTRYDGVQWWADAQVAPYIQSLPSGEALPAGAITQDVEDLRLYQELLLAQPNVIGIDVAANAERLPDGALAALTSTSTGGHYRVVSLLPELTDPINAQTVPPPDRSTNLTLPQNFSPRVRDLAHSIAAQKTTAYEQAIVLESYLRNLPYSYRVRPVPVSGDAVDLFLFEMREGYCTYYASSMVVMARSLGIPARLAIGYATGSYDAAFGGYIVREANAHAWPELLINGRWLPFEPTPIQPLPARQALAPVPVPVITEIEPSAGLMMRWSWLVWLGIGLFTAGVVLLGGWLILQRQQRGPLEQAQHTLEQIGAQANITWPVGATLHEYTLLIEERSGAVVPSLRELVLLIEQARYGNTQLGVTQIQQLKQARKAFRDWARHNLARK